MKQQRYKPKGFYIYGRNVIREALRDAPERLREIFVVQGHDDLDALIADARERSIPIRKIDRIKAQKRFGPVHMQGIAAYYAGYQYATWTDVVTSLDTTKNNAIVIIDGIEDVQNYGAIIRSSAAVGAAAVCVPSHKQAPINDVVFTTSAGTVHKIPIIQFVGTRQMIADVQRDDFWVYGIDMEERGVTHPAGNIWKQKFDGNTAFVVGAEGRGLSQKVREDCDFITSIPMEEGVESLNVSVATAVALYEWKRQSCDQ